jgi:methionine-rich copper-binding protein CopC
VIRRVVPLLAVALLLACAPAAGAHALLEGTSPQRSASLDRAPGQVVLRFSESVEVAFGAVRVYDARGGQVQQGDPFHPGGDPRAIAVRLRSGLADDGYTATYRVISADSHPVSGGFVFGVGKAAAPAATVGDLLAGAKAGPVTSVAFSVVRALQFGAIALAVGALILLLAVWLPALAALAVPGAGWDAAAGASRRAGAARCSPLPRQASPRRCSDSCCRRGGGGHDVLGRARRRPRRALDALRGGLGVRRDGLGRRRRARAARAGGGAGGASRDRGRGRRRGGARGLVDGGARRPAGLARAAAGARRARRRPGAGRGPSCRPTSST